MVDFKAEVERLREKNKQAREEMREEIEEGFARAIFVSAWSYACGELTGEPNDSSIDCYCCDAAGVGAGDPHFEECEAFDIAQEKSPGPGEDWMDYAPPTSEHARKVAKAAIAEIEKRSTGTCPDGCCSDVEIDIVDIYEENAALDGHRREPTLDSFGHDLGMEWLGTGVGWSDDHPDHGLDVGNGEYMICDVRKPEEGDA